MGIKQYTKVLISMGSKYVSVLNIEVFFMEVLCFTVHAHVTCVLCLLLGRVNVSLIWFYVYALFMQGQHVNIMTLHISLSSSLTVVACRQIVSEEGSTPITWVLRQRDLPSLEACMVVNILRVLLKMVDPIGLGSNLYCFYALRGRALSCRRHYIYSHSIIDQSDSSNYALDNPYILKSALTSDPQLRMSEF